MAWQDHIAYQPIISANPAAIRPLGDFVLVRPLSDEEGGKLSGTALAELSSLSEFHMTQDYRYRWNRPRGNRFGEVIAIGAGDTLVGLVCNWCNAAHHSYIRDWSVRGRKRKCTVCGEEMAFAIRENGVAFTKHAEMLCSPGDIVAFPQVPANEIEINGEKLVFLHQEQHVLAVIEREAA